MTIQAPIIERLRGLKRESGMNIPMITNNPGIVGEIADRVAVMYAGQLKASFIACIQTVSILRALVNLANYQNIQNTVNVYRTALYWPWLRK